MKQLLVLSAARLPANRVPAVLEMLTALGRHANVVHVFGICVDAPDRCGRGRFGRYCSYMVCWCSAVQCNEVCAWIDVSLCMCVHVCFVTSLQSGAICNGTVRRNVAAAVPTSWQGKSRGRMFHVQDTLVHYTHSLIRVQP